ncbi:uncharacterized protein UV8b_02882 [Ustilaginoidea virens]|uniref:PXA domain-containing protein n=1 Tax=Ustilaginoidea virens TaxID=1159556 RepID=A0A8E5HNG2_USTVR|nr:uncharacterized protein UV8b_02882 [Ustilaginoidea virens]QUC18641.1 hypothetical protein UV8b_02882 [Ustilaginoidea virens]
MTSPAAAASASASAPKLAPAPGSAAPTTHKASKTSTPMNHRRPSRAPVLDALSDRATQSLIRKVLLPRESGDKGRDCQTPIDQLLPPLTSRNDVDLQLYALLAIILREYIQAWYSKITPDEQFVAEVVRVIAHCTRALEQRVRVLDLENLLFNEIPEMVDRHVTIHRSSHQASSVSLRDNSREAYHALWPLPFLSPVPVAGDLAALDAQLKNEAAYRQLLAQAALSILLPTEDLENPCLTALVGQIFSELIIGNAMANKAAQPWLLLEVICTIERSVREKKEAGNRAKTLQSLHSATTNPRRWSAQGLLTSIIRFGMLFLASARFAFDLVMMSSSLPARRRVEEGVAKTSTAAQDNSPRPTKVPILSFSTWACLGNVMDVQARMPWLSGFLSLLHLGAIHGPGRMAALDSTLDRLLSHHIRLVLSASHLAPILRTLRGALFPNNAPGSPSMFPPSSDEELRALRGRASKALLHLLPATVARIYLGHGGMDPRREEDAVRELEQLLSIVDDEYCNKHLMYSVLELVLVRLMPELETVGVEELLRERLG